MWKYIELRISSNYVNVLNFLVFDAVLISLVYLLTADVMGRLNDSTLRDGQSHRLVVTCPPVLGGGLCSTHRLRALLLLTVRLLGLGLILMTNLTIEGETRNNVVNANVTMVVRGNIADIADADEFHNNILRRTSCQGNRPPAKAGNEGNATIVYYGDIRQVRENGADGLECVTDRSLLTGTVVEFGSELLRRNMTVEEVNMCPARVRTNGNISTAVYQCPSATLSCLFTSSKTEPDITTCRGIVRHAGETYMTEDGSAYPGMKNVTLGTWIKGVDVRDTFWLDGFYYSLTTLKDTIDAAYGARMEKRLVKQAKPEEWTVVNPLWFAALVLKLLLVISLGVTSVSLKQANFRTAINDEQRLAELLSTMIEENSMHERRKTGCEEGSIFLNARRSADGLLVTADIHPRTGQFRRRNSDMYRLEEQHM